MYEEKYMQIAINEAYEGVKSDHGGPFGAVIVKGGEIISLSHNTVLKDNDPTQHAEIKAISMASSKLGTHDLKKCVIYSTTEPCPMCFSAIHWANIDTIVYGTSIEDVKKLGFNELAISAEIMKQKGGSEVSIIKGYMIEECKKLLDYWKNKPDRQVY